jgi:hypothetical protein
MEEASGEFGKKMNGCSSSGPRAKYAAYDLRANGEMAMKTMTADVHVIGSSKCVRDGP